MLPDISMLPMRMVVRVGMVQGVTMAQAITRIRRRADISPSSGATPEPQDVYFLSHNG